MKWTVAVVHALSLLAGCANPASQSASDCALALRLDAATYLERGFTRHPASTAGQADASECDDMGSNARGIYFPEHPRKVDVWSFDDQDPREVLGVPESKGRFRVFIAQDVSTAEATEILETLEELEDTSTNSRQ